MDQEVILKRFEAPDEVTEFEKGRFETVTLGGMTIGRATYQPGWKWSEDVGPGIGEAFCTVEHVVGNEPYVSLHFLGAGKYAR